MRSLPLLGQSDCKSFDLWSVWLGLTLILTVKSHFISTSTLGVKQIGKDQIFTAKKIPNLAFHFPTDKAHTQFNSVPQFDPPCL